MPEDPAWAVAPAFCAPVFTDVSKDNSQIPKCLLPIAAGGSYWRGWTNAQYLKPKLVHDAEKSGQLVEMFGAKWRLAEWSSSPMCVVFSLCTTSLEAIILRWQLRWLGHVIRMPGNRLPRRLLHSELSCGRRSVGGQKKGQKLIFGQRSAASFKVPPPLKCRPL